MKKTLAFTFILGALTGSAVTAFLSGGSTPFLPTEERPVSNTAAPANERYSLTGEVLDIPGESVSNDSRNNAPEENVGYESHYDSDESGPTQMERFERTLAAEPETPTIPEEHPTSVPEEAPSENPDQDVHEEESK